MSKVSQRRINTLTPDYADPSIEYQESTIRLIIASK